MTKNDRKPGALVTGSSRGIGAAIARRLAELGYGVCINYMASEAAARDQVRTIEAKGGRAIAVRADVALFSDVEHMVQKTAETFGGIRVVVNNAGLSEHTTVEGLTVEAWNRAVAVNLSSAFYAVKAALPYLRSEPWGRIVNICSLRAMTGSDHGAHYAAAKAGLIGLTKSLALELAPAITVNANGGIYMR